MFEIRPYRANNSFGAYNPFREMEQMEKAIFGDTFRNFFSGADLTAFQTDISDEGDHYVLETDLPGFDKKDIKLDISGDTLTIRAERNTEKRNKGKDKYLYSERSYGSYSRAFDVSGVDTDKITAKYKDGVLTLQMPKKQEILPESRHLEIE